MLAEERGSPHRFNEILAEFPRDIQLDKFLFQDESLLWAKRLPLRYRFRSLGVMLCLICASFFILLDIIVLSVARSALAMVVACLPLPLIVLPLSYAVHRLRGSQIQIVTNYRVMQCTDKLRTFFIRSLSFHVISGIIVKDSSTVEFSIKEFDIDSTRKKSSELRSMVFRGIENVNQLETLVQRQLNSSLSEFQYPPNIDSIVRVETLPPRYRNMLPQLGINPLAVPAQVASPPPSPRGVGVDSTPQLLWISSLPFLQQHRSVTVNILRFEVWAACIFFSPALVSSSIIKQYLALAIVVMLAIPIVVVMFNYLLRVDVLTSHCIAFFSVGFRICGYGPQMETLDYKEAFPHSCEILIRNGTGIINFENIPPKGLAMIRWPDVLVREELIFRKHCLAYMNNNSSL